jgi:hypothetical protein
MKGGNHRFWVLLGLFSCLFAPARGAVSSGDGMASEQVSELATLERVTAAIDRGLEYLAAKQEPEGNWTEGHAPNALAMLAFMGRGHTPGRGPYREVLERAKRYALATQREDGLFMSKTTAGPMYEQALMTLAMAEMYGMDPDPKLEAAVRKAVELIVKAQSPSGGWRYQPRPGDEDLSVTAMQAIALRAANNAEIPVPAETISKALAYIRRCRVETGGFCYTEGKIASAQMSVAGALSLQLLGQYDDQKIARALDFTDGCVEPTWGSPSLTHFCYFHYYAMQAHYQAGGKYWNSWHPGVRDLILARQKPDGSWETPTPIEPTETYPTTMMCLVLEIYMHYLPAYQR